MEALSDINVQNATDIMHILFEIEDKHTIDIERIGGKTAIIIDDDDMRNNILNIYLNYWYDKRQVFSLDKYSDNKDPRVIEYKSWRGRFSSHETYFENSILQNIREAIAMILGYKYQAVPLSETAPPLFVLAGLILHQMINP